MLFQYQGHIGAVTTCAWSPNGNTFISGGDFEDPTIRLWDATNAIILMYFNQDHDQATIEKQKENENSQEEEEESEDDEEEDENEGVQIGTSSAGAQSGEKKKKKTLTEEEIREVNRKKRKSSDKRSGRKKAMDLFELKIINGLGVEWMTRTSMLLLCQAYLTVGDPQVGLAIFDEMVKKKYRVTEELMALLWIFIQNNDQYKTIRKENKFKGKSKKREKKKREKKKREKKKNVCFDRFSCSFLNILSTFKTFHCNTRL